MEAWKQLIHTALLGTEKSPNGTSSLLPSDALAPLLQEISARETDGETKLLQTATALYLYRRCGVEPLSESINAATAESETQSYCSDAATKILKDILKTGSTGLLYFWLLKNRERGSIFPPELLDVMLGAAAQNKELRPLTVAGAGKRGEWLCSLNADWDFAEKEDTEDPWQTGTTAQRTAFLKTVRTADPEKARTLLETVWSEEKADVREAFMRTFEHNLTAADIAFLEKASTDKSKRVKAVALDFLLQIPESPAVKAFEEPLRQAVNLKTTKKLLGLVHKTTLEITTIAVPESAPNAVETDSKETRDSSGATFNLVQAMGAVPPSFWESHLELAPAQILELFQAMPHSKHYLPALRNATIRFGDRNWAPLFVNMAGTPDMGLVPLLPAEEANTYLLRNAKGNPAAVLDYYAAGETEWLPEATPDLLDFMIANSYTYNRKFFNNHAHQIPRSILPMLDSFRPKKKSADNDYSAHYAAQMWETTREHLNELLTLKEKTTDVFSDK